MAIDPGMHHTGIATFISSGEDNFTLFSVGQVVNNRKHAVKGDHTFAPMFEKIKEYENLMETLLEVEYAKYYVCEAPIIHGKNVNGSIALIGFNYVLRHSFGGLNSWNLIDNSEWKKHVFGNGRMPKDKIQETLVNKMLPDVWINISNGITIAAKESDFLDAIPIGKTFIEKELHGTCEFSL